MRRGAISCARPKRAGLRAQGSCSRRMWSRARRISRGSALADLFLDTRPYNAHSSASDALWAGVPVLTQPGDTFAGRVGASLLSACGLAELIAEEATSYEAIALATGKR